MTLAMWSLIEINHLFSVQNQTLVTTQICPLGALNTTVFTLASWEGARGGSSVSSGCRTHTDRQVRPPYASSQNTHVRALSSKEAGGRNKKRGMSSPFITGGAVPRRLSANPSTVKPRRESGEAVKINDLNTANSSQWRLAEEEKSENIQRA